jgi:hypothetical protein
LLVNFIGGLFPSEEVDMSIFLSLTYKHPEDAEAIKIEKEYKAVMKDFLKFMSYRDAKKLFIKTAIKAMKALQAKNKEKAARAASKK